MRIGKTGQVTISNSSTNSGFIVEEMENFPGIKTARVAKEMGSEQKVVEYIFSKKTKEKKASEHLAEQKKTPI